MVSFRNVVIYLAACLPPALTAPAQHQQDLEATANKYIITLKQGIKNFDSHIAWVSNTHSKSLSRRETRGVEREFHIANFNAYAGEFDAETIDKIKNSPEVATVERDQIVTIPAFITDDIEPTKRSLTTQTGAPWGLGTISHKDPNSTDYIYDTSAGEGTYAYTIDSGILTTHDEFGGRATLGYNVLGGSDADVTVMANIVAVKVFERNGSLQSVVISGFEWAVNDIISKGIQSKAVVNLSLTGGFSAAWSDAISNALASGILSVVAAGNSNADASVYSPASAADAITVGAIASNWTRSSFSNYGAVVDIFGPGTDVLSSFIGSNSATYVYSGTSMATPHVSGVVLYLQALENLTAADVPARLRALAIAGRVTDPGDGSANFIVYNGNGA